MLSPTTEKFSRQKTISILQLCAIACTIVGIAVATFNLNPLFVAAAVFGGISLYLDG
jgi:hypothetical protein